MPESRREEALHLAEETLGDIELGRISATDVARKVLRLARLLDDVEAVAWLRCEVVGFERTTDGDSLTPEAFQAALRSNRKVDGDDKVRTASLAELEASADAARARMVAAADAPVSVTSANPHQFVAAPVGNRQERAAVQRQIYEYQSLLAKVTGALYDYVAERHLELRFGDAVETAFDVVRSRVDEAIGTLVPRAVTELVVAFENAASESPAQWRNAAAACRHLLKAAADALRPPGDPVDGRAMDDEHYLNRLVDWLVAQGAGSTRTDLIASDLEFLGHRLDAVLGAGHKGSHTDVTRSEASRFITGTYLLLGDLLELRRD